MKKNNYVVMHCHTEDSLLDSCTNYKLYVDKAVELKQMALAFTEHGNIYNWIEKKMYCDEKGIKYIHGIEIYLTVSLDEKVRDNYHTILLAKNHDGVKEINELISLSTQDDHFYYRPRITFDEFFNISDNVIKISACLASPLNKYPKSIKDIEDIISEVKEEEKEALQEAMSDKRIKQVKDSNENCPEAEDEFNDWYISSYIQDIKDEYKKIIEDKTQEYQLYIEDCKKLYDKLCSSYDYYEIQPHVKSMEQIEYNKLLYQMSQQYHIPLIAGTDTHSVNKYKAECRSILQKAKRIMFSNEDEFDLTYKSYDELLTMFKQQGSLDMDIIIEAIENTNKMADSVEDFQLDTSVKYPKLYDNEEDVLKQLIKDKLQDKIKRGIIKKENLPKYKANILEEMRVFKKINMVGFMLFMSELVCWCWDNDIPIGFCRGSVGGSTIAYITDIIDVDPIVWNTIFSRFANEDRQEVGDIDIDISPDQRELVYNHIIESFGYDKTAYILAIGTVSDKGTIDEIGRALELPLDEVAHIKEVYSVYKDEIDSVKKKIKNLVEAYPFLNPGIQLKDYDEEDESYVIIEEYLSTLRKKKNAISQMKQLREVQYPNVFYYFDGLNGTAVSQSFHPAGIVVSPITLPDNFGTFWNDGKRIMCINMEEIHDGAGLVKYDLLALKNIQIIRKTCEYAGVPYPKSHEIDWEDKKVWADIASSPAGIFQMESKFAFDSLKEFKANCVNDLSLINASIRPSGSSYRDRLLNRIPNKNPSPLIDELLKENNGYLCIEENQLVSTVKKGLIPIKDINVGDEVYTCTDTSVVNKVMNNGVQNVYRLYTSSNELTCTKEHKILTENGWKKYEDIQIGECICTRLGTVSETDYNKNLLKLIGWHLGDGRCSSITIFYNRDIDVIKDYKRCVEQEFVDMECVYENLKGKGKCLTHDAYKVDMYKLKSVLINRCGYENKLNTYFKSLNLFDKVDYNKFVPKFVFSLNKECIMTILGAYTDTDSSLSQTISYTTVSTQLKDDIVELLRLVGYSTYVTVEKTKSNLGIAYHIGVVGANTFLEEIKPYSIKSSKINRKVVRPSVFGTISVDTFKKYLLSNNVTINKVQKKSKISLYSSKYIRIESVIKICDDFKLQYPIVINNNIHYEKVISKEYVGNRNVYDLEIEKEHNFIVNGIVVHNCFQEDTIKFLQNICGLSGSEADNVRRAIGRKQMDRLQKALPQILEGYCNMSNQPRKVAEEEAKAFLKIIEDSANYQFGYNHSTGYSMIGYTCAYYRYYYPEEFIAAYLNCASNSDDLMMGTELAKIKNVAINNIRFGKSESEYTVDKENHTLYKGIESIKFCNGQIANELMNLAQNNTYDNFVHLLKDIDEKTSVNSRQLNILIGLNFFSDFGKNKYLMDITRLYSGEKNKKGKIILPAFSTVKQIKKDKLEEFGLTEYLMKKYAGKETAKLYKDIDNEGLLNEVCNRIENKSLSVVEQVKFEKEYLNYVLYTNPRVHESYYIVTDFATFKNPLLPRLVLHNIKTGEDVKTKMRKGSVFKQHPFGLYSILKIDSFTQSQKSKKVGDVWIKTEELEPILENYEVIKD